MNIESSIKSENKREKVTFLQYLITSLLWTESMPSLIQYLFLFGVNIQYLAILFWGQFEFALNSNYDEILDIIQKVCKAITFQSTINPDSTLGVSLTLNSACWAYLMIFVVIFGFIVKNYKSKGEMSRKISVFINLATCFHLMIGFWISNIILLNAVKLAQDSSLWSNQLLAINIINLIMIIFNYVIGVLSAMISYDPLSPTNFLSSHTPVFQVLTFLLKAFLAPVIKVYADVSFAGWYFVIVAVVISLFRYIYLLRNFPYYNYLPMRISISFCSAALVSSVASLIALAIKNSVSNTPQAVFPIVYAQAMVIPLFSKFGNTYLENSIVRFVERKNNSLKSEVDVLKKLFALNYLIKKTSHNQDWTPRVGMSDLKLWGVLASQEDTEERDERTDYESRSNNTTLKLLLDSIRRMKTNVKLKMILASHMANDNSTIGAALSSLSEIPTNIGISQFVAIKLHRRLQQKIDNIHNLREGVLDVKKFVDQTIKKIKFNKMLYNNSIKFADFWDTYRQSDLKIIELFKKCEVIDVQDKKIREYWNKYIEPEKTLACSLSMLYSIYLSLIRNAPYSALKMSESHPYFNLNKDPDQENAPLNEANFFSSKNMSFTISMSKEKLGRVLYMSPNVTELIGWTKYDVLGHNINRLLPNDLKEQHNLILQKHLQGLTTHTRKPKMYRNLNSNLLTKNGQVLPCNTYVAIHPYIQQELVYIGFVRLLSKPRTKTMPASENYNETENSKVYSQILKKTPTPLEPTDMGILPSYTGVSQNLLPSYDPMESFPTQMNRGGGKLKNQTTVPDAPKTMNRETTLGLPQDGNQSFGGQDNQENANGDLFFSLGLPDDDTRQDRDRTRTDDDMSFIPDERAVQEKIIVSAAGYNPPGNSPLLEKKQKETLSKFSQFGSQYGMRTMTKDKKEPASSSDYSTAKQNLNSLSMHVSAQVKSQKKNIQKIVDLDGSVTGSLTSNRSSAKNYMSKLEQGVYRIPKQPQIRTFRFMIFSLIVVASALLIFFGLNNDSVLNKIQGNVQVLSQSTLRLFRIVDINRLTRTVALVGYGLLSTTRFAQFAPGVDTRIIVIPALSTSSSQLNDYNNEVRNSLHLISASLQQKFYATQITYKDFALDANGNIGYASLGTANMFDLVTILVGATDAIVANGYAGDYANLNFGNYDIDLIVLNSLNDLLVSGEEVLAILQQDNDQKFQAQINTYIAITAIIGGLCCLIFAYFYSLERILLKKRDRIIDIFLRLDEKALELRTSMVHKFRISLEKDYFDVRKLDLSFGSAGSYPSMAAKKVAAKEFNIIKRKRANLIGLNLPVLTMNIYTITLLLLVLLAFLVSLIVTIEQSNSVTKKVEIMMQCNLNLYNINLAFSIMYEYIYSNKTFTVHNNPITDEWETSYAYISKSQSNFLNLINEDSSISSSEEVNQYIKGDLCELLSSAGLDSICLTYGGGAFTKGIIGGVSMLVSTIGSVIQTFDSSSQSFTDMYNALDNSDLVGLDVMAAVYLFPGFEAIASFIKARILENIGSAQTDFLIIVILFIVLYIVIGYLLWKKVEFMFKRERSGWRKMIRLVPQTVINNNKMLKDFLLANSDGIMDSIKRHLH